MIICFMACVICPSVVELIRHSRCRFLVNSHLHGPLAQAMYAAIKQARVNDKFQDPLYLFLELVRAGVMHGHLWSNRAFSGGPSFGTGERFWPTAAFCLFRTLIVTSWLDDEKQCMLLVMRVLSIVPLNFKVSRPLFHVDIGQ